MTVTSLGLVAAAVSNTPVALAASYTQVHRIVFSQTAAATAIVYVGAAGMNPTTGAGVMHAFLPAGTAGQTDKFVIDAAGESNALDLSQFAVASGTVGQGAYVSASIY